MEDVKSPNYILSRDSARNLSPREDVLDNTWLKGTFIINTAKEVSVDDYNKRIRLNRYYSNADSKFTSTAPGMAIGCNPKPQFTRYADIRRQGMLKVRPKRLTLGDTGNPYGLGMGRYYSEAIDDSQQRIFLRFGNPSYAFLLTWFMKSFDVQRAASQGRGAFSSSVLSLVSLTTSVMAFVAAPVLGGSVFLVNAAVSTNRFMTLNDNMPAYWFTVDNILNTMLVRDTMLPSFMKGFGAGPINSSEINRPQRLSNSDIDPLRELLYDVIEPTTGKISVFSIALRGQAAYNRMLNEQLEGDADSSLDNLRGIPSNEDVANIHRYFTNKTNPVATDYQDGGSEGSSLLDRVIDGVGARGIVDTLGIGRSYDTVSGDDNGWLINLSEKMNARFGGEKKIDMDGIKSLPAIDISPGYKDDEGNPLKPESPYVEGGGDESDEDFISRLQGVLDSAVDSGGSVSDAGVSINAVNDRKANWVNGYWDYLKSEFEDGAGFAIFNVTSTGSVSESFSNSFQDNPLESAFNSLSARTSNITNIASSITNVPVIGDAIKFAGDLSATVISSATFGLANPLLALAYGAKITMPKRWESSDVSMPKGSYQMKLISPYGNPYSRMFNIYLPLAMILAGSLSRSSGSASYIAPFYCQLFDRGRVQVNIGMIDSLTITRGTSSLPFNRAGKVNAIDVDISITNLDEVVSVDIAASGLLNNISSIMSPDFSDTPFITYMNMVTGVDVYSQFYRSSAIRLHLAERYTRFKQIASGDPAMFALFTASKVPFSSVMKTFMQGSGGLLQDSSRT